MVEHYLKKIERNENVFANCPEELKPIVAAHITWAKELSSRLDTLDYQQRDYCIRSIIDVMDEDYVAMGYTEGRGR